MDENVDACGVVRTVAVVVSGTLCVRRYLYVGDKEMRMFYTCGMGWDRMGYVDCTMDRTMG